MRRDTGGHRICHGIIAGVAGSVLMQLLQVAGQKLAPAQMPPIRQHPGEYMVQKGEGLLPDRMREKMPQGVREGLAQALGLGYGTAFTVLYAMSRRAVRSVPLEGSVLGVATWGAGYLGWLPATRLMPPITKQKGAQVFGAIGSHLLFGIATVALYRALRRR